MKRKLWVGLLVAAAIGCEVGDPADPSASGAQGSGGAGSSGTGSGSGGSVGAGGSVGGSGGTSITTGSGTGGASVGGSAGTTGGLGGTSGGSAGAGGASAGGTAGAGGSAGGAGGSGGTASGSPPVPSDGCGNGGRPSNGLVTVAGTHIYAFPPSYDGTTPMPMLMALHAAGNQETQLKNLTDNTDLADNFVRVFPKSSGTAWVKGATDDGRITAAFNEVLANYCVDTSRVFLTGHSSGAQMAVQLICADDTRFKAVAPVAASKYCNDVNPIPAMYIQGITDAQRGGGNGSDVVAVFSSSNSCSDTTSDYPGVDTCNSTFNQKAVDPGCIQYAGCTEPTVWCSHNDEGYNNTDGHYHGWPCFASNAMAGFFSSLP